jgi:hypothetical protein
MNEWNIQTRAHACQACGQPFADKTVYHTLLFDEKRDFVRLDVCAVCWQNQYSQGARDRKGFLSYWQGLYEAPPASAPDPIKKETAETLLRKLIELNDPQFAAAGFILAVMLERKRLLKVKEQFQREGQRVFIYEQPATGDLFTITDPNLQLNQLEQVQQQVAGLLEHGLPPPGAPGAPGQAPGPTPDPAAAPPLPPTEPVEAGAAAPAGPEPETAAPAPVGFPAATSLDA